MLQQHLLYLRKAIKYASSTNNGALLSEMVGRITGAKTPVYQMIRDIVCDARFYSVVENDDTWRNYSLSVISEFIDSLSDEDWSDEEIRTGKKEDLLNDWLTRHIFNTTGGSLHLHSDGDLFVSISDYTPFEDSPTDMTNSSDPIGNSLPEAMQNLADGGIGNMPGMETDGHEKDLQFLYRLDPTLVELAEKIGRSGGSSRMQSGKFKHASKSDISGVTVGDDLNSLLPSELALLGGKATENIFYQRYVEKRLQLFSSASQSFEKKEDKSGPIYICVDTSGSMIGQPETAAKTLAYAIAILAQRDKRPICMINYSHQVSFFILTDLKRQRQQFLSFLSYSYDGGNDENKLFNFIFTKLPKIPDYSRMASSFAGADLLLISDYQWGGISENNQRLIADAREQGMKIYGLGVNVWPRHIAVRREDEEDFFADGYSFLANCDHIYLYENSRVKEFSVPKSLL